MRRRTKRVNIIGTAVAVLVLIAYIYFPTQPPLQSGDMSLHVIDVGQGDCLLLESGGEYALIDAGNAENGGEIVDYLQEIGVERLKLAAATHPHADHIGGMAEVLQQVSTELFVMSDAENPTKTFENMLDAVEKYCDDARFLQQGDRLTLGGANIEVLSPAEGEDSEELNNMSLVLSVEAGGKRFLLTGDSESVVEERYAPLVRKTDVLKVAHHGSSTSSSRQLLGAASPQYAAISCGAGNTYGHPHKETLDALENVELHRTDICGSIVFTVREGEIYVRCER